MHRFPALPPDASPVASALVPPSFDYPGNHVPTGDATNWPYRPPLVASRRCCGRTFAQPTLTPAASPAHRGAGAVSIYSLDGMLQQPDPGAWLDADIAAIDPPEVTSEYLRRLVTALLDD
jgi:hypothetical protein